MRGISDPSNMYELKRYLEINKSDLIGETLLPQDIISMANCHSAFIAGEEEEDDIDALDMVTAATISDIFIENIKSKFLEWLQNFLQSLIVKILH